MSELKSKYGEESAHVILGQWVNQVLLCFDVNRDNQYNAMLKCGELLEGIYNFGHAEGSHQQTGENLIKLLKINKDNEG